MKRIKIFEINFIIIFLLGIYSCSGPRYNCDFENATFYSMDRMELSGLSIYVYDKNNRYQGGFIFNVIENCGGNDTVYLGKDNPCFKIYIIERGVYKESFFHLQPNRMYKINVLAGADRATPKFHFFTDNKAHILTPKEFISKSYKDSFQIDYVD